LTLGGHLGHGSDLMRYLDGDLDPVETFLVEEHLERCEDCRGRVRFERALLDGVRARLGRVASPPALRARIRLLVSTR
jgi:anti-sigma factor RsiW